MYKHPKISHQLMDCVIKKLIPQFHKKFFVSQNAQHAMQKKDQS